MKPTPTLLSPQNSTPPRTRTTALPGGRTGARTAMDGPEGPSNTSDASPKHGVVGR